MTVYSKEGESLLKQYEKENDLMFPLHKSDSKDIVRVAFIKDLMDNENFRKTNKANEHKLEESFKTTIKKFGIKNYIEIVVLAMLFSPVAYGITQKTFSNTPKENKQIIDYTQDIAAIMLILLASICASLMTVAAVKQASTELAYERAFSRISIRLFYDMKKRHPELDEKMLLLCNPEMARVIRTLLIANIPDKDLKRIKAIAKSIISNKCAKSGKTDIEVSEDLFNEAMIIVKSIVITNPWLKKTIQDVYKGKIPAVFIPENPEEKVR